jgi:hypothetical protein
MNKSLRHEKYERGNWFEVEWKSFAGWWRGGVIESDAEL